ncbi:MAG: cell division FtsA domain-containing protein [Coprobacillaceae bacterium]
MKDIYAILDIGSSTMKLLIGESVSANINILYAKKIPSHGIKKGMVEDERLVVNDILKLIAGAEASLETKIHTVGLNIPALQTKLYQSDSSISLGESGAKITKDDIIRVLRLSSRFEKSADEEIVSIIPVKYHSDSGANIEAPINQNSRNLIVDSLIITTNKKILYPYISAVEKAGLGILDISINAFSCAKEAFDAVYLQEGALLIDMGYKTSTISFYKDGYLKYLTVSPVGGYGFTRNIARNMQISMDQAETYKIKYGSLDSSLGQEDIIHTTRLQDGSIREFTQKDLADFLQETAYDVMEKIRDKIVIMDNGNSYETLIVGGGGELAMLDAIAEEVLNAPVRVYRPDTIGARDMSLVSSVGMIYYLRERAKILGDYESSLMLPDVSSTMSVRFKGLTKSTSKGKEQTTGRRINRFFDSIFNED